MAPQQLPQTRLPCGVSAGLLRRDKKDPQGWSPSTGGSPLCPTYVYIPDIPNSEPGGFTIKQRGHRPKGTRNLQDPYLLRRGRVPKGKHLRRRFDALLDLIGSFSITGSLLVSVNIEERIVEALFAIASKLRLQPNLLPTWFRLNATTSLRISRSADSTASHHEYSQIGYSRTPSKWAVQQTGTDTSSAPWGMFLK